MLGAAVALAVVVGGSWFGYRELAGKSCDGQVSLTVAAAAEIAPALRDAAARWVDDGGAADGTCVAVEIGTASPVDVTALLAAEHGVALAGVGGAAGNAAIPDVWVPDSSIWVDRLRAAAPGFTPAVNESLARSPVVVGVPEPVAGQLGWPQKKIGWTDLLAAVTGGAGMKAGVVEPTRDAAGLSGLLALGAAAESAGAQAQQARIAALRALAAGRSAVRDDLMARFPQAADAQSLSAGLNLAAVSEEAVIAFNTRKPPVPLAALYLEPAPLALDYPYTVMPGIDPAKNAAAGALRQALATSEFRDRLGGLGLRGPDGVGGAGFAAPDGAPSGTVKAADKVDVAAVEKTLASWAATAAPARMLAVIDVSGTMRVQVPSAGNATRMQVTVEAARRGLSLFGDDWAVGLWIFATHLNGGDDWRELVPIRPLAAQRSTLVNALGQIQPTRGDTGLYDTIAAAYENVQEGWQPGRVNSVLVLTDGIGNDDPDGGLSQQGLMNRLQDLKDPRRPIQLIILGIGDSVNRSALEQITRVTGGGVLVAADPAQIGEAFLRGISLRPTTG